MNDDIDDRKTNGNEVDNGASGILPSAVEAKKSFIFRG